MRSRVVTLTDHADLFVPGMMEMKEGTCSNMPMLHLAIGRRLGWPLKAVVTSDHMWRYGMTASLVRKMAMLDTYFKHGLLDQGNGGNPCPGNSVD